MTETMLTKTYSIITNEHLNKQDAIDCEVELCFLYVMLSDHYMSFQNINLYYNFGLVARKPVLGFRTKRDSNQFPQLLGTARKLKVPCGKLRYDSF